MLVTGGKRLCPVQWAAGHAVVTLPDHLNAVNADLIGGQLVSVIAGGAKALVADMTGTLSCDYAAVAALIRVSAYCFAKGRQLRVAAAGPGLLEELRPSALPELIRVYPSLAEAMTGGIPSAQFWPAVSGPGFLF